MKTTAPSILVIVLLVYLSALPAVHAVVPAPDGGYPGANTAEGENALFGLTTGTRNTANGNSALFSNTTGNNNMASGAGALRSNATGFNNTANGVDALLNNTAGFNNTANGFRALSSNTTSSDNTATGYNALQSNTTGQDNTASGASALEHNTTGDGNTADGVRALTTNTDGRLNAAFGWAALLSNDIGSNNTASGYQALAANTTGSFNIALGFDAGASLTTGDNNIDIGNAGVEGESVTIRIGEVGFQRRTFIAGIHDAVVPGGTPVYVNSSGQLGASASSARFKEGIKPMEQASEALFSLKPVTFHYKKEIDPAGTSQFGLVSEEVEKVNPDLVTRDKEGKAYSVRYEAVNAMLLNEFLKEHRKSEQQRKDFEAALTQQQKQIEMLTAGLQRVTAQLELSKPATQTALNNQ